MSFFHWVTAIIMIFSTVLLIGWDIIVAVNDIKGDTISEIIQSLARRHLIVPLSFGVLGGHFFWPGRVDLFEWWQIVLTLVFFGISSIIIDVIHNYYPMEWVSYLEYNPAPVAIFGFLVGHIFWAQQANF